MVFLNSASLAFLGVLFATAFACIVSMQVDESCILNAKAVLETMDPFYESLHAELLPLAASNRWAPCFLTFIESLTNKKLLPILECATLDHILVTLIRHSSILDGLSFVMKHRQVGNFQAVLTKSLELATFSKPLIIRAVGTFSPSENGTSPILRQDQVYNFLLSYRSLVMDSLGQLPYYAKDSCCNVPEDHRQSFLSILNVVNASFSKAQNLGSLDSQVEVKVDAFCNQVEALFSSASSISLSYRYYFEFLIYIIVKHTYTQMFTAFTEHLLGKLPDPGQAEPVASEASSTAALLPDQNVKEKAEVASLCEELLDLQAQKAKLEADLQYEQNEEKQARLSYETKLAEHNRLKAELAEMEAKNKAAIASADEYAKLLTVKAILEREQAEIDLQIEMYTKVMQAFIPSRCKSLESMPEHLP